MCDVLFVHVIKTPHHLVYNISRLLLRERWHLSQTFEQLTTSHVLRYDIVIVSILYQLYDSDDVRVALLTKDAQFILQKLDKNVVLLHRWLLDYLAGELLASLFVHAYLDKTKRALP